MMVGYKNSPIGKIPLDWEVVKSNEVFELIHGFQFREKDFTNDGLPIVKISQINRNGEIDMTGCSFFSIERASEFKDKKIKNGDVLMALTGATLGKSCWVAGLNYPVYQNYRVGKFNPINKDILSKRFLYFLISSPIVLDQIFSKINSGAQGNIGKSDFEKLNIPLPPLPEQQKLADILSTVDEKIEVIEHQIDETENLRKGLMQRLLTKGLGHTEFKNSPLGKIPKSWTVERIGNMLEFKNGLNKEKKYFGKGVPIVNYMDVFNNRELTLEKLKGKVDVDDGEKRRFNVKKGDVFFTRTSETIEEIGYSACFVGDVKVAVFSGFVLRARPINDKLDLYFKKYCFNSYLTRKEIINKSTCTTRALTNGTILSNVQILLPPKEEQQKIALILGTIDEKLQILKDKKNSYLILKKGLMQQLLTGRIRVNNLVDA